MQKRVLITGEKGYIGKHIQKWLLKQPSIYNVEMLNVRTDKWKNVCFKGVDVLVHTAGIVHQPDISDWEIYKKTNIDLSVALAQKAKEEGVRQFVFFSTMAIYGKGKRLAVNVINEETEINPVSLYGKSKYIAETEILKLQSDDFKIVIIRPPNVFGKDCKGGYISGFKSVVSMLPVLPYAYPNIKQSTIYIDNLCELIRLIIESESSGCFMPQDRTPISAIELMTVIADNTGLRRQKSRLFGIGIYLLSFLPIVKKAYGGVAYSEEMTAYFNNQYVVVPFEEGIRRTLNNG